MTAERLGSTLLEGGRQQLLSRSRQHEVLQAERQIRGRSGRRLINAVRAARAVEGALRIRVAVTRCSESCPDWLTDWLAQDVMMRGGLLLSFVVLHQGSPSSAGAAGVGEG